MDRPQRLPTTGEALLGAAVAFVVGLVLVALKEAMVAFVPFLWGSVLLGYGVLRGIGWLFRKATRT